MFDEDELEFLQPKMTIDYRVKAGLIQRGSFDEIPENAFGANITTFFPVIGADGKMRPHSISYDLFVGKEYELDSLLEKLNRQVEIDDKLINANGISKAKFTKYKSEGVKKVALTKLGFVPLRYGDTVFYTSAEMATAITNIGKVYKSLKYSVKNVENSGMHR